MKSPTSMGRVLALLGVTLGIGQAVNEKKDGWPWNLKLNGWHDREITEELGTGWFLNVGPTGIRVQITHEHPQFLTTRHVFKNSPAAGLVKAGDVIVGANGIRMDVPHTFGRHKGWQGPMIEMSKLIEDSQGKDGKLNLIIWPGGKKEQEKNVTVQIKPVGRFSPTWPYDCPRSNQLLTDLCDFLVSEHKRAGKFESSVHTHGSALLALMAAGPKYDAFVANLMQEYRSKRYDPTKGEGFPVWGQVHDAIVMGEYYLLHKDKQLKPAIESLAACLNDSVWPETGGLSHRPYAFIQRRLAEGGPKGYGSMGLPAGLGMVGLSLFKEAGLPYAEPSYQRIHQGFLESVGTNGSIGYGFSDWDHAVIEFDDASALPKSSPRGIGFECPGGMKGAGTYRILWPTKADKRYRPTDWLEKEADTNRVYDSGGKKRMVIRNMAPEEPTRPYEQDGRDCDHYARSGVGALAHKIGNDDQQSWGYLGDLMAEGCAKSPDNLLNGHASTHMHVLWGSLGAAMAKPESFRAYLDGIKWWFIMAETHNGGFVVLPGRDYASTDHVYGTRNFPTACAALILSVKEKRLRITGRSGSGAVPATGGSKLQPSKRKARALSDEKRAALDGMVRLALRELSHAKQLSQLPITLSKARTKVWLEEVDTDLRFHFRAVEGDARATFGWDELNASDHAMLAAVAARFRKDNSESQALAGVYMEAIGDVGMADLYYRKAGPDFAENINKIFE